MVANIPKADMHVHLEGTVTPARTRQLAERNGLTLTEDMLGQDTELWSWKDDGTAAGSLSSFVQMYDSVANVIRTSEDYADITYDYLSGVAKEGCIYSEIILAETQCQMAGLTWDDMISGIVRGYEKAKDEYGIEARFQCAFVRHVPPEEALKTAQMLKNNPHPLMTGLNTAGDENANTFEDFKQAYDDAGLPFRTAHAGEAAGPESVRAARDILGVKRFGHMVRAIEDDALMRELVDMGAVPEVCVSSNLTLKVYDDYSQHPLRKFFDAGLKVCLGSDDPPFFGTTIGREYQIAKDHFGFNDDELVQLTRNGIENAFIDEDTRQMLLKKLA